MNRPAFSLSRRGFFGRCLLGALASLSLNLNLYAADPANGKTVYQMNCQACHQPAGAGIPGAFPPLADNANLAGNPDYIAQAIVKGVSGPLTVNGKSYNGVMPSMAHISDSDIADLVAYILSDLNGSDLTLSEANISALR